MNYIYTPSPIYTLWDSSGSSNWIFVLLCSVAIFCAIQIFLYFRDSAWGLNFYFGRPFIGVILWAIFVWYKMAMHEPLPNVPVEAVLQGVGSPQGSKQGPVFYLVDGEIVPVPIKTGRPIPQIRTLYKNPEPKSIYWSK